MYDKPEHIYVAIDLKSFYASVECIERGLNPLTTNLVVADKSRSEKTICLAVSPSLKMYGIPGRARLFQVIQKVKEVNQCRKQYNQGNDFISSSIDKNELLEHPELSLDYIIALPRMSLYLEYSVKIYQIYLKYVAPEDIHVYSIDEVFIDITSYLYACRLSPYEFVKNIVQDVCKTTGIVATAGIGTNLYLSKVALDIVAKHIKEDGDGVRIASLNEVSYRRLLWGHQPLTDFWRVGKGYRKKLEEVGLYTMGDIARCSIGKPADYYNEELLFRLFGINAELLIDHAWGWESCTIEDIKAYRPNMTSIGAGQVLHQPYTIEKARLIVKEMIDLMALDLVDKERVGEQIVLTVGYDIQNLLDPEVQKIYTGKIIVDHYGRKKPKHAHGTVNLKKPTSSSEVLSEAVLRLYDRIVNPYLLVRRIGISINRVIDEKDISGISEYEQLTLFVDDVEEERKMKEKKMQKAVLSIKKRYGKNAILKGMNLQEGATTIERNSQIGGHKA